MTTADQLDRVLVPRAGLRRLDVGPDVILFDRSRGLSHLLNTSAALVWSALDGVVSVDELIEDLVSATGSDRAVIEPDVLDLVTEFEAIGLTDPLVSQPPHGSKAPSPWSAVRRDVLDRWPSWEPRTARCAGATVVEVRSDNPALAEVLDQILSSLPAAHGAIPASAHTISIVDRSAKAARGGSGANSPRVDLRLYVDGEVLGRATSVSEAAEIVLTRVNLLAIDNTPNRILLHAGAVEHRGRVLVIAGVSGRGKSTLTAALVQAGNRYLTDEMVAIEPRTWAVEPFTKALDLSDSSLDLLGVDRADSAMKHKHPVDPSVLGATSSGGALAGIVLLIGPEPDTSSGASSGSDGLIRLDPAPAVIEVLRNTFDPTMDMPGALEEIAKICTDVPIVTVARADLRATVERVSSLLGAD